MLKIPSEYGLCCKGISIFSDIHLQKSHLFCKWGVNVLNPQLVHGSSPHSFGLSHQWCRQSEGTLKEVCRTA